MYFADLSEYSFGRTFPRPDRLNVGWLSRDHAFAQGPPDPRFVARLKQLIAAPVNLYRGYHVCEFCPPPPKVLSKGGIEMFAPCPGTTGTGEIHVSAIRNGHAVTYVAPVLVFHYVVEHQYKPPQEFIEAVNNIAGVALIAENLSCVRGGRLVFRDVNFRVASGEILQVEGPNGSGKTSLLRLVAGLLAPAVGTLRFEGAPRGSDDAEKRSERVGWLGHQDGVKLQLTPRETLRFYAQLYGTTEIIDGALEAMGLARAADLPCQYLSAGQKRRLALARLKLTNRRLWLLDEPLAALDTEGKSLIVGMLRAHADAGGLAIAATHEPLGPEATRLQLP